MLLLEVIIPNRYIVCRVTFAKIGARWDLGLRLVSIILTPLSKFPVFGFLFRVLFRFLRMAAFTRAALEADAIRSRVL